MGEQFYAAGGMKDFFGTADSVKCALQQIKAHVESVEPAISWYEIVDSEKAEVVEFEGNHYYNENSVVFPEFDSKDPKNAKRIKAPGTPHWSRYRYKP